MQVLIIYNEEEGETIRLPNILRTIFTTIANALAETNSKELPLGIDVSVMEFDE